MKRLIQSIILIGVIISNSVSLDAQNSGKTIIKGIVSDASTGDPLIGASIALEGTSYGTSTNLDGEYILYNVPAGTYTLQYRYLGYKDIDKAQVAVVANQTLNLNVEMNPESILEDEVIVTAQAKGQMAAINQQRASNSITNIVASDRIREVPDVTAAESIGRLPGVALQRSAGEGNKVVIRGLSPNYSIVEIDGVRMEGTGGDRSVSLANVSSESLGGIELSKSLTADKDADAIGGIINMKTRVADEGFHVNANATGGYNSFNQSTNNYSIRGSVGNRFFNNQFGILASGGTERVNRNSDDFQATYDVEKQTVDTFLWTKEGKLSQNLRDRQRSNVALVLDYKNDFMKLKLNNMYSNKHDKNEIREAKYLFKDNRFEANNSREESDESFQMHAVNTEWKFWTTTLEADYAYSKSRHKHDGDLYNFRDEDSFSGTSALNIYDLQESLPGDLIDNANTIIAIENAAVHYNWRDDNLKQDVSQTVNLNWFIPFRIGDIAAGTIKAGYRHKTKNRSSDEQRKELEFLGGNGNIRRTIVEDNLFPDYVKLTDLGYNASGLAAVNFDDKDYDYGNFLNGRYEFPYAADIDKLTTTFDSIYSYVDNNPAQDINEWQREKGIDSNEDDYETTEKLNAGYVMATINLGKRVMIMPGVRYENINTEYSSRTLITNDFAPDGILTPPGPDTVTAYRENGNWFPSVNMKVGITDWMDVRAAYYKSASRPSFSRLSPSMVTDQTKTRIRIQNPTLNPAIAHNVDLGLSFFTGKLGLFTINGFYKNLAGLTTTLHSYQFREIAELQENGYVPESIIETLEAPRDLYDSYIDTMRTKIFNMPINNPNAAEYAGFELSWQTNLWYLPGLLSGFVVDLNYSMLWSQTKVPYIEYISIIDTTGFIDITTEGPRYAEGKARMVDQPNILFNAKVGWDYKGFSSRVSFRYQASTITSRDPAYHLKDAYNLAMVDLSINLKQQITPELSISLDGTNLTNYIDDRVVLNNLGSTLHNPSGENYAERSQMYGMGIRLGIRYEF